MKHATHMTTPVGSVPIRPEVASKFATMTDREVADKALRNGTGFIDPEYFAELLARGLSGPGMFEKDTYRLIENRERVEIEAGLEELEERRQALLKRRAELDAKKGVYWCSVCGVNQVDVESGFDTCPDCLAKV